jgi:cell shape-determining protein MreD
MIKHMILLFVGYAALVLDAAFGVRFAVGDVVPRFLPLVVMLAAFWLEGWPAVVWGAAIGLLSDSLNAELLGAEMACAAALVLLVQRLQGGRRAAGILMRVILGFVIVAGLVFLPVTLRLLQAGTRLDIAAVGESAAMCAVYSLALGLGALVVLRIARNCLPMAGRRA